MGTDRQRGIQQQYALLGPARQIARRWNGGPQIALNLLEDILQRRGKRHAVLHRETQPVGLAGFVVGVLADDDHFHPVERAQVEGIEDELARRVASPGSILLPDDTGQLLEVRLVELALQVFLPRGVYLYICHNFFRFACKVTFFFLTLQAKC